MGALETLAAKFVKEQTPLDPAYQLELLMMYEDQARKVVEALPQPYVLPETTVEDMATMKTDMKDLASQVSASVSNPSVVVPGAIMRSFIVGAYVTATYHAQMFAPNPRAALLNSGEFTADEINTDLGRRINVLKAIALIGKSPLLIPLYEEAAQQKGTQGLGFAPVVIGGVAVASELVIAAVVIGLAVIAALAYVAVSIFLVADTNRRASKLVEQICFDKDGKPYPATAKPCLDAALEMQNEAARRVGEGGPGGIVDKVILYGAIGLGVYAAIVFLPDIIRSVRSSKQAMS